MILRATILLLSSQIIFLLSGFLVNIGLARMLGPASYGLFSVVLSILVVTELLVVTGIPEAIQKFGAERPELMKNFVRKTLLVQIAYIMLIFGLFGLFAPVVASIFHDGRLIILLRIAGFDILFVGLYKYYLGIQNGLRQYRKYAVLNIVYSVVRAAAILLLVYVGYSIRGALIGNFICSISALIVGLIITRFPAGKTSDPRWAWKSFVAQNVIYFVALNMLFAVDIWFVKYFLTDNTVGQYVSAANLAKLTYFLSVALSAVLLPELSHALGQNDFDRVRDVVQNLIRWLAILLMLIIVVVWLYAQKIILLFYGVKFLEAYPILRIVIVGYTLITLSALIHTVLISQNRMSIAFFMVLSMLTTDLISNRILVPVFKSSGAAMAAGITGVFGTILGIYFIRKLLVGVSLSRTAIRVLVASVITIGFSLLLRKAVSNLFLQLLFSTTIYGTVLLLSGEVSKKEMGELWLALGIVKT